MTIIASYGGTSDNAYLTVTAATSFVTAGGVLSDLRTAWTDAATLDQEAALRRAAIDIDSRSYIGRRFYSDQFLDFPRETRRGFPFTLSEGTTLTLDATQVRMKRNVEEASIYQAIWIIRNGGINTHMENSAAGISGISESVGPLREFVQYKKGASASSARLHPDALSLLSPWLTSPQIFRR